MLARELGCGLGGGLSLLIAVNPCFGIDFGAVAEIHARLRRARESGYGPLTDS